MDEHFNGNGGIVYVLLNEAMPGYVKIGRTDNLEARIRQLDTTSVPIPFECFYAARVSNARFVEAQMHSAFEDHRVRKNREFFELAPERAVAALKLAEIEEVTPGKDFVETEEDQKALNKARERRSVFNFRMAEVPVGVKLEFTRDNSVTCEVLDNRKVLFEGEEMSVSAAAQQALAKLGYIWKAVQGPLWWEYEGETLDERRRRLETSDA